MDLSYNLVASKCAEQMAAYQQCVLQNQNGDWSTICRPQGQALTACADSSVPHLPALKATCHQQITSYRQCLESNSSQSDDEISNRCGGLMKDVWECCERVVERIEREGGDAGGGGNGRGENDGGGRLV